MNKFSLVSLICFVGAGACAVACGSDDDTSSPPSAGAGGKSGGAGAAGKGGGGSGGTSGSSTEAGSGGEGGEVVQTTLYERLGGHDGIAAALDAIVTEELKDPIIASYFSQQANPSHKPSAGDIGECFTNLLGKAAGGPEAYPSKTSSGFQCRSMAASHATLGIGAGTFDKFVTIAAGVLTEAGVAAEDVATIGEVLNGTKADIVDPNVPSGAAPCKSPASCAVPVGEGGASGEGGAAGSAP